MEKQASGKLVKVVIEPFARIGKEMPKGINEAVREYGMFPGVLM